MASEPPTITGTFGKYTLVSELGRGAMGIVYEAIDAELHRTVALKMLLTTSSLTPEDAAQDEERFLREARVCANLPKHPNIVGVHEAGVINGRRYIAMEFVKGRQMSAWSREPGVSLRRKVGVLRDTAFAIEHAHRHRVVHRDLKPHNVLIDAEGRPHVMDFGLAKRMTETPAEGHLTIQGVVAGTPAYMSPEQAEGRRDVDHRTDIYAMGIMLFEILADRVPFIGTTPFKVMVKVVQDPMPSPAALAESKGLPTVDPALERICLKAVAKKAADRYAAAGEFAADLSRWLEGQKVTVVPPRNPVKRSSGTTAIGMRKPAPSSRGGLIAAAVAGTVVLAVVAALLLRDPPPPDRTADDAAEAHRAQAKIVSQLLEEAEAQTAAGRHSAALVTYGKVLARDPRNPAAIAGQHDAERRIEAEKSTAARTAAAAEKAKIKEAEPVRAPKPPEDPPPPARPAPPSLAAAAVDAAELAPGLVADYYSDRELGQLAVSRLDPAIDFRWSGPAWPGGPSQSFSARWRGFLRVPKSGLYTLQITSGDGARLFVDETLVVANWKEHREATDSVPVGLDEGFHALRVEYFQGSGEGVIRLAWSEAAETARAIPAEFLLHKASGFKPFPAPTPAPSPAAALPPPARLAALLAEQRDRLRGHTVTLVRPGAPETAATIKEVGARDFTLVGKVAGGGTLETVETVDSLSPATLAQIARRAWPAPSAEQLRLLFTVIADRGDLEAAWKEAERVKAAGMDARDAVALLVERERAKIDGLKTAAEKGASIKKTLALRAALLDEDQKRLLASDLAGAEQPARPAAWKLQERPPLAGHEGEVRGVAFSPDGKLLASAGYDSSLRLWDAVSGQPRGIMNQGSPVWRAAFSPDGKTLAASDSAKRVRLWDPVSGAERLTCSGHANQVVGVVFSPNGQCLASASTDNSARVWDPSTGKEKALLPNHAKGAVDVSFSPDGRLLAVATADHQVQIWDWAKPEIKTSLTSHTGGIGSVSFSPDGRSLLTASRDGTLKLWEAATGKERLTLNASGAEVCSGAFSPDGRLVASLSKDGILKLWDAASGKELLSLKAHTDYGRHLAFSPTGRMVATAGGTPALRIFDLVGLPPSKP